jgi:hypothetical protein
MICQHRLPAVIASVGTAASSDFLYISQKKAHVSRYFAIFRVLRVCRVP